MQKDRLIALFSHLAENPEAEVEMLVAGESCGWYSVSEIASNDLDDFSDWKPAPPKPRVWRGRAKVNEFGGILGTGDPPKWVLCNEVDITITEVLK